MYYAADRPIDADRLARRIGARSDEELAALESVLCDFFEKSGDQWKHKRCDELIAAYLEKAQVNQSNGKKGGRPPGKRNGTQKNPNGYEKNPNGCQKKANEKATTNHEPLTINQEPIDQGQETSAQPPEKLATLASVVSIPINTGDDFPITQEKVDEMIGLYPAVDVLEQLKLMRGWCLANPTKRKTKAGVMRFVANWLAKEQNSGKSKPTAKPSVADSFADTK